MSSAGTAAREAERRTWPDTRLVRECLNGEEEAWAALIDKYKNLIYSIPVKYEFSPEDSADIFQAVLLELLSELPRLREPKALPAWLIRVTSHKCFRWKRQQQRFVSAETEELEDPPAGDSGKIPEALMRQGESEQILREALSELASRCQQLIERLFFQNPPLAYREVAQSLGLATGSIGFIRMRCLEQLRKRLAKKGFR